MASNVINNGIKTDLNDKQKEFCTYYLETLNGTQAYMKAYDGVDNASAEVSACRLLGNDKVKKYINDLIDLYSDNVDITIAEIVANIKSIALDKDARHSDRIKASELLGRWKQMFVDKVEVTNTDIVVGLED